jgi:hypothetical protein
MIKVEEAKNRYLIKAEKNGTNDNITTDNYRFCLNFNESQNKFLSLQLQNRGIDDIRYIEKFLVLDKELLPEDSISHGKVNFNLPTNYFDLASARAIALKDKCKDLIKIDEVLIENLPEIITNEDLKPSFEWRESIFLINSNSISVYVDEFKIEKVLLNYYRYPNQIKLVNPEDPESDFDSTGIEWDDKSLDDIISLMVANFDINQGNPRYQMNTLRTQK